MLQARNLQSRDYQLPPEEEEPPPPKEPPKEEDPPPQLEELEESKGVWPDLTMPGLSINCYSSDLEDASFEFFGDTVHIKYREYCGCGDWETYEFTFPLVYLWMTEEQVYLQIQEKVEAENIKRRAKTAEAAEQRLKRETDVQEREKDMLKALRVKYPDV